MPSPAQPPTPARSETGDPLLLTPGPLTTSKTVKQAMVHDWGSRDATFIALNAEVMDSLPKIIHGEGAYVTVPMQGSGTFAVEAMLTTFVPRDGAVLVLINGAYGQRAKRILTVAGRKTFVHETAEDTPPDLERNRAHPRRDAVHHPRLRRPLRNDERHSQSDRHDRRAVRAAWQAPADRRDERFRRDRTRRAHDTVRRGRRFRQQVPRRRTRPRLRRLPPRSARGAARATRRRCRSTCSTNVAISSRPDSIASPRRSTSSSLSIRRLQEFWAEGGVAGRGGRYAENARILIGGMRSLGFETLLPDALASADHRHLPHAKSSEFRLPALLRFAEGPRLRDLSWQADRRRLVPHRLHRPPLSRTHARRASGGAGDAG